MKDMAGKWNANVVWLFAALAIGLSFALTYVKIGNQWVGLGLTFVVFAACAWLGSYLTGAKTGMTILAMLLAVIGVFVIFYLRATSAVTSGISTAASAVGGTAAGAAATTVASSAASTVGFLAALLGSWKLLGAALAGGIAGAIAGNKMKSKLQEAAPAQKAAA